MNGVIRSSFKLASTCNFFSIFGRNIKTEHARKRFYSTFWNMCNKSTENNALKAVALVNNYNCKLNRYSTKSSEIELAEFLEQEISAEQQIKPKTIPSKIDAFEVKLDGSEVTLIKEVPGETIEINFNINHSVESNAANIDEGQNSEYNEIRSKPTFEVDIKRGDSVLGFTCSYLGDEGEEETEGVEGDVFNIDEITLYKGEWNKKTYAISGDILDACLYDLMMNLLDEKGISNEFVNKMSELSTAYEHSSYISLLRDLKKFAS